MMRHLCQLSLLLFICLSLLAQGEGSLDSPRRIRMMSYNVENLFDTINQPERSDDEFTPEGAKLWDTKRLRRKTKQISEVIALAGAYVPVDLVALQEVEVPEGADYLWRMGGLKARGYSALCSQSSDSRGVGLMLLYRPRTLEVEGTQDIVVPPPSESLQPSRPLFYVWGKLASGARLHLILCHLPSRRMGRISDRYRQIMLGRIAELCAEITEREGADALIAVLGDMNSSSAWLSRSTPQISRRGWDGKADATHLLYNISRDYSSDAPAGSYAYRGTWETIDQILLSRGFFTSGAQISSQADSLLASPTTRKSGGDSLPLSSNAPIQYEEGSFRIYAPERLRSPREGRQRGAPKRTFLGDFYQGGYSDHFPVFADFLLYP